MHIAVFADIEGSFGIWRMRQCKMGTAEWQYGRHCLTEDINHVVKGAFDAGADLVTVKDTHEIGFNCLINKLDSRAKYVGGHFIKPSFYGNVADYDLILYVAIHASSGTENAFFPHTHYGVFSKMLLNGKPVGEMDIYAGYLGEFGIPIGFVSGENIAVEQALKALPWAKSVVVDKHKEAYTSGEKSREYLSRGRQQLRETAAQAVRDIKTMKPLITQGPLTFEAEFRNQELANKFNTWNFKQSDKTVEWKADNMIDGFENLNKLTFYSKRVYPVRRPFAFLTRCYYRLKNTYFHPSPNSEGAEM
ncbi:M55 family metallopeptidase [bacterium]|nr:M55 family metallopeptidase [bacterium]